MSPLSKAVGEYLTLRRGLGFQLERDGVLLPDFLRFLQRENAPYITTDIAVRWATQPTNAQAAHWARRLAIVRHFAQYQSATDPRTEIPPLGVLPHRYHRKPPYIYRDDEVVRLLQAAGCLRSKRGLRPQTYTTLFGVLAATGLRVSEGVALNREDVDLPEGVVTIHRTKFGKSRLVPLHGSTQRVLQAYARRRDQIVSRPRAPSFFVSEWGTRLTKWGAEWIFRQLSHQIGLRAPGDRFGPRLHDLRHSFAVRTLLAWYRTGANVEAHLLDLATYLGHTHVTDTYWYLSATPELLQLATQRLEGPDEGPPS